MTILKVMPLPSGLSQKSNQADELYHAPFRGIATAAIGALGVAMTSPLVLAVTPSEFIGGMSLQSFVAGLAFAIIIDYTIGHLTGDSSHWPKLPAWVSSEYVFIPVFVSSIVGFMIPFISAPSWAPAVAIGGMHAFATAGVAALIIGGSHGAVWTIRRRK